MALRPSARCTGPACTSRVVAVGAIMTVLDGIEVLAIPYVEGLQGGDAPRLPPQLVVAHHGIVVDGLGAAADVDLRHLLSWDDLAPEDDVPLGTEELENGQELPRGVGVAPDSLVDAGAKHLAQIWSRHPAGRDVVDVGLGA